MNGLLALIGKSQGVNVILCVNIIYGADMDFQVETIYT